MATKRLIWFLRILAIGAMAGLVQASGQEVFRLAGPKDLPSEIEIPAAYQIVIVPDRGENGVIFPQLNPAPEAATAAQLAVLATAGSSLKAVTFPDANMPSTQSFVPGLPSGARPHGSSFFGSDSALVCDFFNNRIFVIQPSTSTLLSTIDTTASGYTATGTIAVAPDRMTALAIENSNFLYIIKGPFGASSAITSIALPGASTSARTQSIVFNAAGRAFVSHSTGVSVIDPPYTSVAFTIPMADTPGGGIAISPDGTKLLVTSIGGFNQAIHIYTAPYSAASDSADLNIPGANGLVGIMVAPNGSTAIAVSAFTRQAVAILAPFTANSTVQNIPLPANGGTRGYEDVGISGDGQLAMITGQGAADPAELAVLIRAPFGSSSATSLVPVSDANPGRGAGSVRFAPAAAAAISGRVTTPSGQPLRNAIVTLIDSAGARRTAVTSPFGLYSFANVATGQTYTLTVTSKRYRFAPQTPTVSGDLANADFSGLE